MTTMSSCGLRPFAGSVYHFLRVWRGGPLHISTPWWMEWPCRFVFVSVFADTLFLFSCYCRDILSLKFMVVLSG